MKICCLSDIHGNLPVIPECDILLLAGDYSPMHSKDIFTDWFLIDFVSWLKECKQRCKYIVGIAGNHDFFFDNNFYPKNIKLNYIYNFYKNTVNKHENWYYLENSSVNIEGFNIYGTPYQKRFYDWAFNLDEEELNKNFEKIPENTDIILTHGPPCGILDKSVYSDERIGSLSLKERALEINAKLVVFGHNHDCGILKVENTIFVNASYVDNAYVAHGKSPIIVEL